MSSLDLGFPPLGSAAFVPVSWFKSPTSASKTAREVAARYDTTRNTDRINVRTVETSAHLVPFRFGRSDAHGRFRDLEERIQSCQSLANVQLRPAMHLYKRGPFISALASHTCAFAISRSRICFVAAGLVARIGKCDPCSFAAHSFFTMSTTERDAIGLSASCVCPIMIAFGFGHWSIIPKDMGYAF